MAAPMRSTRSHVSPSGRDGRTDAPSKRPELHVVSSSDQHGKKNEKHSFAENVITWTKTRSRPWLHTGIAVLFLILCWIGTLLLRTQMVENSFESARIEQNITMLQQDVEDDQAKLSNLEATLPDRAQKLNMVPASGSLSIDLQGYKAPEDTKQNSSSTQTQSDSSKQNADADQGGQQ